MDSPEKKCLVFSTLKTNARTKSAGSVVALPDVRLEDGRRQGFSASNVGTPYV